MTDRHGRHGKWQRVARALTCCLVVLAVFLSSILSSAAHMGTEHMGADTHAGAAPIFAISVDPSSDDGPHTALLDHADHCGCYHFGAVMPALGMAPAPMAVVAIAVAKLAAIVPSLPSAPRKPPRI